ncbi:hypothetical protein [Pedobacter gandavensis]|uniref:hypothetical protein n=1 Tax=Pedobacter gandavensis TaxID=2679963 RepID=UPI002930ED63|nr:hypothetical protein [Pedobacter gandavensis]
MNWIKKMKFLLVFICLMNAISPCHAQTWAEFFKQKKTQKKYLLQQIVALEVYVGYLNKGYKIVDGGLTTIKDISNGEFKLHDSFINSLKQVSPVIRKDARIAEIISLQIGILKSFTGIKSSSFLSADNIAYISLVADGIATECYADLEELLLVITTGKLEMKEDERLKRLDKIYKSMLDKSGFTQDFCNHTAQLIRQKQLEQMEIGNLIKMFHINE